MPIDYSHKVELLIRAGTSKGEALEAIESLLNEVDRHWDRLITDPDKQATKGGTR